MCRLNLHKIEILNKTNTAVKQKLAFGKTTLTNHMGWGGHNPVLVQKEHCYRYINTSSQIHRLGHQGQGA